MLSIRKGRALLGVGVVSLLIAASARAQETGSLSGTVRDNTGAILPGAEVVVTNVAEATPRRTHTNGEGDYLVAGLPAGSYNLSIAAKGFKTFEAAGIVLRVAQKARVDAVLEVGAVTTTVEVQGAQVAQVETDSSELSGTVTQKQISQLVLNGRNFTQLVTLVPGVSNQTGQDEGTVGVYGNVAMSVNGGRTEYNNWELDGGDNMDNGSNSTLNVYPNVDAIAEVTVLTSNYGAQYGRNGSGTIETVTKSGTKEFHGDVFEFLRNEDFNANNFFNNAAGIDRPEYRKNDYGYTIGGPVFIPHVFNTNRDKTFFFFSEDWRKERVPQQVFNQQVPSADERNGNFNDVCPGPDCPMQPNGQPFPNNQVPVDPNAKILEDALIPAPNSGSGATSFFAASPITPTNWREELVRIDENFSDNTRFFFRFIHDSWNTITPTTLWSYGTASFPTVQTSFVGPGVSLVAHLTNSISPSLLNEFVFSYTTDHIFLNTTQSVARPSNLTAGALFNGGNGILPGVDLCCNAAYGGGEWGEDPGYFPWTNSNPSYTYRDNISKIAGKHNLTMGAYFAARQKNETASTITPGGILTFNSTFDPNGTGNAFADFLLGNIYSYHQSSAEPKYYNREKSLEPYFQDDWRISPHVTLNLGVRVSLFGTYREKYKNAYNFDPHYYNASQAALIGDDGNLLLDTGTPFDGIVRCGTGGVPVSCMKGHLFNPAPRVGFAWDLFGDGKTALRGGYGVFYEITNGNEGNTESLESAPPLVLSATQYSINGYTSIGGSGTYPPLSPVSIPTQIRWPYVQQWHFDLQHELPFRMVTTVSYVGSKGTHLTLQRDLNQLYPVQPSQNPYKPGQVMTDADCATQTVNGQPVTGQVAIDLNVACGGGPDYYRPYYGYGSITALENQANSNYNALQVSVRRSAGRLNLSLAYTYSHSLDDSSDRYDSNFLDSYNLQRTYASSNFDQRHLLNISAVYDLPFFSRPGLAHTIFGGWQLSGLMTFQTGTPFSVTSGVGSPGVANGSGTQAFVDVIGDYNSSPPVTNAAGIIGPLLYNPEAFAEPTGLTFGDAGRNILRLPTRTNYDMGLFKHFAFREQRAIEFRAEGYNVFNHTQFNGVNSTASCFAGANNSAGDASCLDDEFLHPSGAHNPRLLQLGAKFIF